MSTALKKTAPKKVSYDNPKVKLAVLSHAIKNYKVLYSSGKLGKGDKWKEIAELLTEEFKMPFKANGVRDWIRDFLVEYNKKDQKHIILTGDEQNNDGKLDDAHQLDRAVLDLFELKESLLKEANEKKAKENEDIKIEETIRKTATQNLVNSKSVGKDYKPTKTNTTTSIKEIVKEGQKDLRETMAEMLELKKRKLEHGQQEHELEKEKLEVKKRKLDIDEMNAKSQAKLAEANLKQQNNFEILLKRLANE